MDPAVSALLVLLVCVVLFITNWIPASMTAVLGCMLMYFVGACDFAGVFAGFADNIVVLVVGSMIVGVAMFDTGTARVIAKQCIRLSGGSERGSYSSPASFPAYSPPSSRTRLSWPASCPLLTASPGARG